MSEESRSIIEEKAEVDAPGKRSSNDYEGESPDPQADFDPKTNPDQLKRFVLDILPDDPDSESDTVVSNPNASIERIHEGDEHQDEAYNAEN